MDFTELKGIAIKSGSTTHTGITQLTLEDAKLTGTKPNMGVSYEWDKIIPEHQEGIDVSKEGGESTKTKNIKFKGDAVTVSNEGDVTTVDINASAAGGSTITVVDASKNPEHPYANVDTLKFDGNLSISSNNDGNNHYVKVSALSPWAKIGTGSLQQVDKFEVIDPTGKSKIENKTLTIELPESKGELKAQIKGGSEHTIGKINITGSTTNSSISDGTLNIDIPNGGSGGGSVDPNFKGFFDSLGDIQSQVESPTPNKSFAYAKDSEFTTPTYTPYFYVNGSWQELNTDPAITYEGETSGTDKAVVSIKSDPKISIDSKGQLDLSKLGEGADFHGFYDNLDALKTAVPTPIVERAFAYVKQANGSYVGYHYTRDGSSGTPDWKAIAPIGAIQQVTTASDGAKTYAPIYGIAANGAITMGADGVITIHSGGGSEPTVEITDKDDQATTTAQFNAVKYKKGKSLASLVNSKLILEHPQRVIQYDSAFESGHNSEDYEGSLFYDETSRCWMGWSQPTEQGGVAVKWTKIAHRGMSDQVKSLDLRFPPRLNSVSGSSASEDNSYWHNSGWSYVEKDDTALPDDINTGGYIQTLVKKVDGESESARPAERIQLCFVDDQSSAIYARKCNSGASESEPYWHPWQKVSLSAQDIVNHNDDMGAHKNSHKFYKVTTLDRTWTEHKTTYGQKILDNNSLLVADSHGLSTENQQETVIPYTGKYRFSGRIEFDGLKPSSGVYPKPSFIMYVKKKSDGSEAESTVVEFAYAHQDQTKAFPVLKYKSPDMDLVQGDKIWFEFNEFKNVFLTQTDLAFITSRTYFVIEDATCNAGSRIALMHHRTMGALNSKADVQVNVHKQSSDSSTVRVYGVVTPTAETVMTKVGQ